MFNNTESDVQELTHRGTYDLHRCFAVLTETPGKEFNDLVIFHGGDGREVESFSNTAAAEF